MELTIMAFLLPGGWFDFANEFDGYYYRGYWWAATQYDKTNAFTYSAHYEGSCDYDNSCEFEEENFYDKSYLFSVRCIKNNKFVPSSSTSPNIVYDTPVTYEGETYPTVVIGTQTWFQRNLNYAASGSKCGNGIGLSDANTMICDAYGRLYNWATAMALPSSCNSSACSSQVQPKHKGICPSGWHIPSDVDWNVLMKFVNPSCSDNSDCSGAGIKLKTANDWFSYRGIPIGTDTYGFAAPPSGLGLPDGNFNNVGNEGVWWSSVEYGATTAYIRGMYYSIDSVNWRSPYKNKLYSIRCIKD